MTMAAQATRRQETTRRCSDVVYPMSFSRLLFALAAGLTLIALLGPVGLGVIDYRYSETMLNQARGLDLFAAVVVAPLAVAAGVLARRHHGGAALLAMGPSGFASYMLVQYVIGPDYLQIDGNGERFFPLFAALFVVSSTVLLQSWSHAMARPFEHRVYRRRGIVLLALAGFTIAGMYLANGFLLALRDYPAFVADRAAAPELGDHPTAYWLVAFLDLAIVCPVTISVGVALLRRRPWAASAFYGVVGWFALVPGSVATMAVLMVARDDPAADGSKAALFTIAALAFAALAAGVFRPVLRPDEPHCRVGDPLPQDWERLSHGRRSS